MHKKLMLLSIVLSAGIVASFYTLSQYSITYPFKVSFNRLAPDVQKQVVCLANNIYYESAYEPKEGKIAVAYVTINRVNSGIFEDNICDVVKQKLNGVCQFSWWCEGNHDTKELTKGTNIVYNDILELAMNIYVNQDRMTDPTKGSLFYHADYVNPGWKNLKRSVQIGRHIFYLKT